MPESAMGRGMRETAKAVIDMWGTRPRSQGRFERIRRGGKPFKGVRKEN